MSRELKLLILCLSYMRRPHVDLILELQLNFLEQGYFDRAMDCIKLALHATDLNGRSAVEVVSSNLTLSLIFVISAYAGCFVRGEWEKAIATTGAFYRFCEPDGDARQGSLLDFLCQVRSYLPNDQIWRTFLTRLIGPDRTDLPQNHPRHIPRHTPPSP
jgi:hypothetical protein